MNILDMKYVLNKSPFPNEISVFSKFESICQSTKDLPFPLSQASPASPYTCEFWGTMGERSPRECRIFAELEKKFTAEGTFC